MRLPKDAQVWLPGYLRHRLATLSQPAPRRLWVAITDHYEPYWNRASPQTARERVTRWREAWPAIAARHADSRGRPPQYCFFYPEEEYDPALLDQLAEMARLGIADVELHIHHDNDTEARFVDVMGRFADTLHRRHGLLRSMDGRIVFGFIHGNWCLDNSRPDGRWCGLNNEITLLRRLGCYADFTMPCGPSAIQARLVNRIYWAIDDPLRPKSYDGGIVVRPGAPEPDGLLMITGPFVVGWVDRLMPRIDVGELAAYARVTPRRIERWVRHTPRIGEDAFLKLFSHGTQEENSGALLEGELDRLFTLLNNYCAATAMQLHYVTAWRMRQAVEALRTGVDPEEAAA